MEARKRIRDNGDVEEIVDLPIDSLGRELEPDSNVFKEPTKLTLSVFKRPCAPRLNPNTDNLCVNWMDIDTYTSTEPIKKNPLVGEEVPGPIRGPVTVLRVFGVDENGCSVAIHVHGFTPYFYCDVPYPGFDSLTHFVGSLNAAINQRKKADYGVPIPFAEFVERQSVFGYTEEKHRRMIKVYTSLPNVIDVARNILEQGGVDVGGSRRCKLMTYESKVPFPLRFMVDNQIVGCNWIELPINVYSVREDVHKTTRCQWEVDVVYENIVSHSPKTHSKIGKLRIFSFDIECMGRKGFFPDPTLDPVIQIACYVHTQGEPLDNALKIIFMMGGCTPINGSMVYSFEDERELLKTFCELIRISDPDVLTGYNVQNFDMPYLLNRCKTLGISNDFDSIGRVLNRQSVMKRSTFTSSAFGSRESIDTSMEGIVMIDMIQYMYRNHKLSSYTLNAVSFEILGQQKEDVHYSMISTLQMGTDEDRRRLAVYCLKDAFLPLSLMNKLLVVVNYIEMARVTGVPLTYLFTRGQQIKVLSMLYRKAREHDMVIPVFPKEANGSGNDDDEDIGYEGATVLEPKCAFYQKPIATLDFASLYPSIMRAHNLCYTTLLTPENQANYPDDAKEQSPCGHWFVTSKVRKGLLPTILEELLTARSQAKKDMKNARDEFERDVMNGRQLALKVSANSVYGFTGATVGALPCIPISASVTAYGREMIQATKRAVEEHYTIANGYAWDAEVVYGDTDSVMVKFGTDQVKDAMELGLDAAKRITKIFQDPISLEFEKVYHPYLLMAKKRYAGLYWTKPEKYDKLDCKGIETVRRDCCQLVRDVIDTCLRKLLIDQSVSGAIEYAEQQISALLQNKIDFSLLIITKSISGDANSYKNKQPHVVLAEKMRKRDPGSAPVVGDRVPYVIVSGEKGKPICDRAEDPLFALENSIPIDTKYYLEQQLSKPLLRLFECIIPNPQSLLSGDHTRTVVKPIPSVNTGILRFAQMTNRCIGCKSPISINHADQGLCEYCNSTKSNIYNEKKIEVDQVKAEFLKLWGQCQTCQGSSDLDVICASRDCPIFYKRTKVKKDLQEVEIILNRLEF